MLISSCVEAQLDCEVGLLVSLFCFHLVLGDIGCYMIGLTDLPSDVKELFIELFRVTGRFLHKDATAEAGEKLKALQKDLVR